jgi:hypothetical protein
MKIERTTVIIKTDIKEVRTLGKRCNSRKFETGVISIARRPEKIITVRSFLPKKIITEIRTTTIKIVAVFLRLVDLNIRFLLKRSDF